MRISKEKYELTLARQCKTNTEIIQDGNFRRATFFKMIRGEECKPITVGKLAKVLGCDVEDLLRNEA